jgi:long-chain fatty acid transport protein
LTDGVLLIAVLKFMKTTTHRTDARELVHGLRWKIILLALTAALPAPVFGLGFLIPNQDAAAVARGNAFVATADDPASIFYNPAGISQLSGSDVQVGALNYFGIDVNYNGSAGKQSESDFEVLTVPQLYWTFSPTNLPVSFGLGIYSPFGLAVNWPKDGPLRSLAIDSKLTYITINPVVSWQATKTLSLAAGPTINYAKIHFDRGLTSASDFYDFGGDDYSAGFTAGLLWKPTEHWAFGASYRAQSDMDFSGESHFRPVPAGPVLHTHTSGTVPFPQMFSAGVSYRPNEKWNLEFDVDEIDWDIGTVKLAGTKNIFGADLPLALNWHPSWQYKFGVTRQLGNGWFVSAGYFFSTDTTATGNFTPAVPDTDLHVGSVGVGHNAEHWHWALAAQMIAGLSRTIPATAGNTDPFTGVSAAGKYSIFVPAVTFSIGYRF